MDILKWATFSGLVMTRGWPDYIYFRAEPTTQKLSSLRLMAAKFEPNAKCLLNSRFTCLNHLLYTYTFMLQTHDACRPTPLHLLKMACTAFSVGITSTTVSLPQHTQCPLKIYGGLFAWPYVLNLNLKQSLHFFWSKEDRLTNSSV